MTSYDLLINPVNVPDLTAPIEGSLAIIKPYIYMVTYDTTTSIFSGKVT